MAQPKTVQIPPLFKADSATLSFYATKDGKISISYSGWEGGVTHPPPSTAQG